MAQLKDLLVMGPGRVIGDAFFGGKLMPTVTETQDIGSSSVKWNIVYAKGFSGPLTGNATTASYPEGFTARAANFTWGNTTGTAITSWNDSTGGSVGFRRDNPSGGKLSLLVDGRVYVSEGSYPVAAMRSLNGYWGMTNPDGTDNVWIRTTSQGLIPYQAAGPTDTAVGSLGTSTWYFKDAYIQSIYGNLTGVASKATAANITSTQYGVAYYSDAAGTFASTAAGTGGTALVGVTSGAPKFASISTTLTHTAGTGSSPSQLKVTVLGSESSTITLTTASTSVYGMTKLSDTAGDSSTVAATPKGVQNAIAALDVAEQTASGTSITFIAELKQVDGKIVNKKMTVRDASDSQSGVVNTEAQVFAGNKSFLGVTTFNNDTTITGVATFNGNVMMNSSASADSLTAGSLVVSGNTSLVNTTSTSTILPHSNNTVNIGASGNKYATVYATSFEGVADKAKKSNGGSSTNSIAYFTDGSGTFGYISSGAGALYASSAGGKPTFGTLPVALGGTEKTSWTKFALVYASNTTVLDSLGVGTAGQILKTNGSSSAPAWVDQSSLTVGSASNANISSTQYGVAYYSNTSGKFASTGQGTSAQALVGGGSTGGPIFTAIAPSLSQASDDNGKLTLNISVLNNSGTAITLTTATTSVYGVTLLANSFTTGTTKNTSTTTAAHPNAIWNAINSLDKSDPTASGTAIQFIATVSETDGIITATKKTVRDASASQSGVVNTSAQTFAGDKTFNGAIAVNNNISATGTLDITGNAYLHSETYADSVSAGSLIVLGDTSLVDVTNTSTLLPHANNTVDIGASGNKYATVYATTFDGVAIKATSANITSSTYGIAYYSNTTGKFASTEQGGANTVFMGKGNAAPGFVGVYSQLTLTAGTSTAAPKLDVSVLGVTTANKTVTLTTATTGVYGVTKLSSTSSTSEEGLAATPKGVWAAIGTLDYNSPSTGSSPAIEFITVVSETDGKISAEKQAVREASTTQSGIVSTGTQGFIGDKTFNSALTVTGVSTFNGNVNMNSSVSADSLSTGSLIVSGNTSLVNTTNTSTLLPHANNTYNIGASGNKYLDVYATTFHGGVDGNASTSTGWFTAATITIGNKSNTLQSGGQSITYTLNDIGLNAAGNEKHPVYISATGVPVACNSETATTLQSLEAISAGGAIGLYSNGSNTCGNYVTMTNGSNYYYLRFSTTTSTAPQASWYCIHNFRDSIYLWHENSTSVSASPNINFYRSAGASGSTTSEAYHEWGSGIMASMYVSGGAKVTYYTDGTATSTTSTSTMFYFLQRSINSSTGSNLSYYEYYHLPGCTNDKTSNSYYTILTTKSAVTVGQGGTGKTSWSAGHLIYSSGSSTLANTSGITTDGYSIDISATYYPEFTLTASTTNSLSKYSRATFQGDYNDNVAMWIYSDKTTTSNSRRGLVIKGYAAQTNDDLALVYRRCDTSGTWLADQYILTSHNWSNYITIPSVETCNHSVSTDYLSNTNHSVALGKSTWTGTNSWSYTNGQVVWGQQGAVTSVSSDSADITLSYGVHSSAGGAGWFLAIDGGIYSMAGIWSAVWNDFAEYRTSNESEPGRVIVPQANGIAVRSTERLQSGARIVSDTYGHSIGYCNEAQTPVGVSGRVLAYPYQDPANYKVGDAVCAAPNGTVDVMSREEIMMYPERIIGIINEIPQYEKWHRTVNCGDDKQPKTFDIEVKGRIWIDIK